MTEAIAQTAAALAALEDVAEAFVEEGAWDEALQTVLIGAGIAPLNHPGRFASPRLERVCERLGEQLPPWPENERRCGEPEHVLHVFTDIYESGGHSRQAWRWMRSDAGRRHSAISGMDPAGVPGDLRAAVEASGGTLHGFRPGATMRELAAELRALAAMHDALVLHIQPHDARIVTALSGDGRPPTLLANHADHCFWLGRCVADVVVSHRAAAATIAHERRGIAAERCAVLPLPGAARTSQGDRAAARQALGLPDEAVLLLSVGSAYKFEPLGGPHLLDLAEPVLARHPNAVLMVAGPGNGPRWDAARARTGGRVIALDEVPAEQLYPAADVYLESLPCSSGTAAMEAAAHGVPLLAFAADDGEAELLASAASVAGGWLERDATAYTAALDRLVSDAGERHAAGARAAAMVAEMHDETAFRSEVSRLYALAASLGPAAEARLGPVPELIEARDVVLHALHARGGKRLREDHVARAVARLRLALRGGPARALFLGSGQLARVMADGDVWHTAIAAPPLDQAGADAVLDELRGLAAAEVVQQCVVAVPAGEVDAALPILEAALARGEDVDIEVVPTDDPAALWTSGALLVSLDGDALHGDPRLAGAPRHPIALAA